MLKIRRYHQNFWSRKKKSITLLYFFLPGAKNVSLFEVVKDVLLVAIATLFCLFCIITARRCCKSDARASALHRTYCRLSKRNPRRTMGRKLPCTVYDTLSRPHETSIPTERSANSSPYRTISIINRTGTNVEPSGSDTGTYKDMHLHQAIWPKGELVKWEKQRRVDSWATYHSMTFAPYARNNQK